VIRIVRVGLALTVFIASTPLVHAEPLVWSIKGPRNTVYLAGSVHLLKRNDATLPAAFDRAYEDAEALVMELDLDDLDPGQAERWLLERGLYADATTQRTTLGEARYERLVAAVNELGLPIEAIQRFEPWAVALTLVELAYARLEYDPNSGVERQLEQRASRDGKEIRGLESIEEQLGLLDALPLADQQRFLDQTVEELDELGAQTEELLVAWRAGDDKTLAKLLEEEYREFPGLFRTLVSDRNVRWMPQIERLLRDDRDYLVVVGVLHLLGDEGVVALAKKRGLTPRRMR
jgi:uncharacterized protein